MAEAIVLAGGFSSRMRENKMHLIIKDKPLLLNTIDSIKPFVSKIIVVTGHYDQDIRSFLNEDATIKIIFNEHYPDGMFSSVLKGVREVKEDFFILPGDIPFIKKETFIALLNGSKKVRYPTYKGKDGHPLFISKDLKESLLKEDKKSNLKIFRDKQDKEPIIVDDENILRDIDTLNEYLKIKEERK
ncbi:MAG: nucleotidyltransferase family protein [Bacilli bacterium]|nr:nucleotidyltransferase family protein [Bacilli bacterium]